MCILNLDDAYRLSLCNKRINSVFQSSRHWLKRFNRDFNTGLKCDDRRTAKSIYKLMMYSWDAKNECFDLL